MLVVIRESFELPIEDFMLPGEYHHAAAKQEEAGQHQQPRAIPRREDRTNNELEPECGGWAGTL